MKFVCVVLMATALFACAAPQPQGPVGPTVIVPESRQMLLRGVTGGSNIDPVLITRSYEMLCDQSPAAPSPQERAAQSRAYIEQSQSMIGEQIIGARIAQSDEARRVNPTLLSRFGCRTNRTNDAVFSRSPQDIARFIITNNLTAELMARR